MEAPEDGSESEKSGWRCGVSSLPAAAWARGAVGSALDWQSRGQGFESPRVHQSSHYANPCRGNTVLGVGDLAVHDHLDEHAPVDGFLLGRRPMLDGLKISSWNAAINSSVTSTSVW